MLVFVSSPYSHDDKNVVATRMRVVYKVIKDLIELGIHPVSPLLNHSVVEQEGLPSDWTFWQAFSEELLSKCDRMVIVRSTGWDISTGVAGEIAFANKNNIPIHYIDP